MKYKAILFDMDGTICNTLPLAIKSFKFAIEDITKVTISDEEIVSTFGPSEEATILAIIPDYFQKGIKLYWYYYKQLHDMAPTLYPGIKDIFIFLKGKGLKIALVTGKAIESCNISLEYYDLNNFFDITKTGNPNESLKTKNILETIDELGFSKDEVLYVGDTLNDIKGCRAAGIKIASALWGTYIDEKVVIRENPDCFFKSVADFRNFLEKNI